VVNGVVSISLAATDHSTVPVTYTVITTIGANSVTTYWSVPTLPSGQCASTGFCKINEVTVSFPAGPSLAVNPAQISTGQSSNGQVLCNKNSITGFCDPKPMEAPTLAPGTVMFFNMMGQLDSVIGSGQDCVLVDGTSGPCGSATWGTITGTLSSQSDLAAALEVKLTAANNLSDLGNAATARANLGLAYSQSFTNMTSVIITHNFNTTAVVFSCFDNSSPPLWILPKSVALTDANNLTVTFASAQSGQCNVVY